MRHLSADQVVGIAIRSRICTVCSQRPSGSETLPGTASRSCEESCPIFLNLHGLEEASEACDALPGSYEQAVREHVCGHCTASPTAGEYCAEWLARTCPVSRYAGPISALIEDLIRTPHGPGVAA